MMQHKQGLIEVTVGNYRSVKDEACLSMLAANLRARDREIDATHPFRVIDNCTLLTSAAIFGANASGKSNFLDALDFMRSMVIRPANGLHSDESIPVSPFLFSTTTEQKPSLFQMVFMVDGTQYRYGFEADSQRICSEWLFAVPTTKEARLFYRQGQEIKTSRKFKEGQGLGPKTRPNELYLSVVAQANGEIATRVVGWFSRLSIISGLNDPAYRSFALEHFASGKLREPIIQMMKSLDLGIDDVIIEDSQISDDPLGYLPHDPKSTLRTSTPQKATRVKIVHKKWDENGKPQSPKPSILISNQVERRSSSTWLGPSSRRSSTARF
jgi:uncharacterized protein